MHDTAAICLAAGQLLLNPAAAGSADARDFLDWLVCPTPAIPGPVERNRARLLLAASRFSRLFSLECPTAPGLAVFGAEVPLDLLSARPGLPLAAASGTGASLLEAFESCAGEGVELLSSVETVTFGLSKDDENVTVNRNVQETMMNIGHRADIQKYEFYDSGSEIQDFSMKYHNNRDAGFLIKDEF